MSQLLTALLLVLSPWWTPRSHAGVEFRATLDAAQETPTPVDTLAGAGGTAVMVFDTATKTVQYTVTFVALTGDPLAAHIHTGARCVAGSVAQALSPIQGGTTAALSEPTIAAILSGGTYVNLHTAKNQGGEIRGQLALAPGKCPCDGSFRRCVKAEVKKLSRKERKAAGIKALVRAATRSSCGKSKGPKKAIACCLPLTPEGNIATDNLCAAVPDKVCKRLGGINVGASCFPTNPCVPASSPTTCERTGTTTTTLPPSRTGTTTTTLPPSPSGAFLE